MYCNLACCSLCYKSDRWCCNSSLSEQQWNSVYNYKPTNCYTQASQRLLRPPAFIFVYLSYPSFLTLGRWSASLLVMLRLTLTNSFFCPLTANHYNIGSNAAQPCSVEDSTLLHILQFQSFRFLQIFLRPWCVILNARYAAVLTDD